MAAKLAHVERPFDASGESARISIARESKSRVTAAGRAGTLANQKGSRSQAVGALDVIEKDSNVQPIQMRGKHVG
jgi:hypothetical protein